MLTHIPSEIVALQARAAPTSEPMNSAMITTKRDVRLTTHQHETALAELLATRNYSLAEQLVASLATQTQAIADDTFREFVERAQKAGRSNIHQVLVDTFTHDLILLYRNSSLGLYEGATHTIYGIASRDPFPPEPRRSLWELIFGRG